MVSKVETLRNGHAIVDLRPALRISADTWRRGGPDGQRQLVEAADEEGLRLVIVHRDKREQPIFGDLGWAQP